MKAIIMLYMLLLLSVTVTSQAKNRSDNKRANGNSTIPGRANKESTIRTNNDQRRSQNSDLAKNVNLRWSSMSDESNRRERNTVNQNTRSFSTALISNNRSFRTGERRSISNMNYVENEHLTLRTDAESYMIHHPRIENFIFRGHPFFHHFEPLSVRRIRFPFLLPHIAGLIWSLELRNEFDRMYPDYYIRNYNAGYRIPAISAYDANAYFGEIATVYGDIIETEYSAENDEYYLYVGQEYPNQDFSIVVPGIIARKISKWPESFFQGSHIAVTGLITAYNNKPEVLVKRTNQIYRY
jgi:hypothetical protein